MARRKYKRRKNKVYHGGFMIAMNDVVNDVTDEVKAAMYEAMDTVAEEAAQKLRATSPVQKKGGGAYAAGWTSEQRADGAIVYNATDYQLTHLLEYGHAVRPRPTHKGKKRRVEAIPHIAPVEKWAIQQLDNEIARLLQ